MKNIMKCVTSVLLAVLVASGCNKATLQTKQTDVAFQANCFEVRSGSITWDVTSPSNLSSADSRRIAIDETIAELIRQVSGTEVNLLSQSEMSLVNDKLDDSIKISRYSKTKGRLINYRLQNIEEGTEGDVKRFKVTLTGDICVDDIVDPPLIVAIRHPESIQKNRRKSLIAALGNYIATMPRLALNANNESKDSYYDIYITASFTGPHAQRLDRQDAINAVRQELGVRSASRLERYVTKVSLHATLQAVYEAENMLLTETSDVDREIAVNESLSNELVAEMEGELIDRVSKKLIQKIETYLTKRRL